MGDTLIVKNDKKSVLKKVLSQWQLYVLLIPGLLCLLTYYLLRFRRLW